MGWGGLGWDGGVARWDGGVARWDSLGLGGIV